MMQLMPDATVEVEVYCLKFCCTVSNFVMFNKRARTASLLNGFKDIPR